MTNVTSTCRDVSELAVIAQIACGLFLDECAKRGVNIFITETYRSQERQDYLYSLGRTQSGNVVTWTKNSNHTGRMAWDIACDNPHALYDTTVLAQAGSVAKELGITWGGDWNSPDMPHFEINENWGEQMEDIIRKIVQEELAKLMASEEDAAAWSEDSLQWGIDLGITDGKRPTAPTSRQEVVTMLHRYDGTRN